MLFNTVRYICFLLIVVLIYYISPSKIRHIVLLVASYYFYMQWNAIYILLLFFTTAFTYSYAIIIDKIRVTDNREITKTDCRTPRLYFALCAIVLLGLLVFFKYLQFGINCINFLLPLIHLNEINWSCHIVLPVGISFYILQALGYLIDVYRGDIAAEKNFFRYALFVSFFPQLVAGPIERSHNLLVQFRTPQKFSYENFRRGMMLILYGLFIKMVIADRAAIIIDTVYRDPEVYHGFYIIIATILFSFQIYCDFYGYSTIARGSALLLGIRLMDNFNAPYYSRSVKEFWRRWHISLSGWFRDYLYIPLGGNRKSKSRKEFNLLFVFGISGLWHGASLTFLFWGILNGLYQVIADVIARGKVIACKGMDRFFISEQKSQKNFNNAENDCFSKRLIHTLATFLLITFAWLFFRAEGMYNAKEILINVLRLNNWMILFDGSLYSLGVAKNHMSILLISIIVLFVVDYYKYNKKDVLELFFRQQWYFRISVITALFFVILLYGCYGELYDIKQFIYFQF